MSATRKSTKPVRLTRRSWAVAVIAAVAVAACGCRGEEKQEEPVVSVEVTPAQKSVISEVVTSQAVIFPLQQATIAPKITSTIAEFRVNRGSRVKKGDLLAVLENKDLAAAAEASRGDLEQAEATYATTVGASLPQQIQKAQGDAAAAQAALGAAQKVYDSRIELFEQGAIPRRELEAAQVALVQARATNEQAQKQLADLLRVGREQTQKAARGSKESAEGKYRAAAAQLSYSEIRSPIDGVVTERPLYVGDLATANQPILTVMNTSRLIAKAHIPQPQAAALRVGNAAELKVPGLDERVAARVTLVSPALDPGSTTVEVWVEARKPDPALRPGLTVEAAMVSKTAKDAVVVPAAAVFKSAEGEEYVLVAGPDEKAHLKKVEVGIRTQELVQIANGVKSGDPVITAGWYAVPDGTAIKIQQGAPPQGADKGDPGASHPEALNKGAKPMAKPAGKEKE